MKRLLSCFPLPDGPFAWQWISYFDKNVVVKFSSRITLKSDSQDVVSTRYLSISFSLRNYTYWKSITVVYRQTS